MHKSAYNSNIQLLKSRVLKDEEVFYFILLCYFFLFQFKIRVVTPIKLFYGYNIL